MTEFKVTWTIMVQAGAAMEAVRMARETQLDPQSPSQEFWVGKAKRGSRSEFIDLNEPVVVFDPNSPTWPTPGLT